jgi:hypothetical protein
LPGANKKPSDFRPVLMAGHLAPGGLACNSQLRKRLIQKYYLISNRYGSIEVIRTARYSVGRRKFGRIYQRF